MVICRQVVAAGAVFVLTTTSALGQSVTFDKGNLWFTDGAGRKAQLTRSGSVLEYDLSPDSKWVAFRRGVGRTDVGFTDELTVEASEIWIVQTDGHNARRLIKSEPCSGPHNCDLFNLMAPQFSIDGRTLFFEAQCYATDDCIQSIDLRTGRRAMISGGGGLTVIKEGQYRGNLMIHQHRYFLCGGSYDWFYVVKPDGKEVGPMGTWEDGENGGAQRMLSTCP